jgi:hypothetical protein
LCRRISHLSPSLRVILLKLALALAAALISRACVMSPLLKCPAHSILAGSAPILQVTLQLALTRFMCLPQAFRLTLPFPLPLCLSPVQGTFQILQPAVLVPSLLLSLPFSSFALSFELPLAFSRVFRALTRLGRRRRCARINCRKGKVAARHKRAAGHP